MTQNGSKRISVRPSLTFKDQTKEAVNFYVSLFPNSKVVSILHSELDSPQLPKGSVLHADFVLDGQEYTAFDGGDSFEFSEGFSFVATCETQQELDTVWDRLTAGGEEGPCGWCKDRFGVSWQVVPSSLGRMISDNKSGNSSKVVEAFLKMKKMDIATLERAYKS